MTEHDISGKTVLVVEVQPHKDIFISSNQLCIVHSYGGYTKESGGKDAMDIDTTEVTLPPSSWQLLGVSDSLTEEQAREIVPLPIHKDALGMELYNDFTFHPKTFPIAITALESFQSWLASQGYDLDKKYAILIQQKNQNP